MFKTVNDIPRSTSIRLKEIFEKITKQFRNPDFPDEPRFYYGTQDIFVDEDNNKIKLTIYCQDYEEEQPTGVQYRCSECGRYIDPDDRTSSRHSAEWVKEDPELYGGLSDDGSYGHLECPECGTQEQDWVEYSETDFELYIIFTITQDSVQFNVHAIPVGESVNYHRQDILNLEKAFKNKKTIMQIFGLLVLIPEIKIMVEKFRGGYKW